MIDTSLEKLVERMRLNFLFRLRRGVSVHRLYTLLLLVPTALSAQTIEERTVDVVYGDQIIRGTHQVVIDEYDAHVIPYDADDLENDIPKNVVISSDSKTLSRIEESNLAEREAEIYAEVNRRMDDAPYTILFAGRIPPEIQKERLKALPEVGIFGRQLNKLENNQGDLEMTSDQPNTETPDLGEFMPIQAGGAQGNTSQSEAAAMLEEMIGG